MMQNLIVKEEMLILKNMRTLNFITKEEHEAALKKPVVVVKRDTTILAPHLRETIRITLEQLVGKKKTLYRRAYHSNNPQPSNAGIC